MRLLLRFISVAWNAIKLMAFEWIAESRWHLRPVLFKGENGLPLHAGSIQSHSPPSVVITITWKHGEMCLLWLHKKLSSNCSHFAQWKPATSASIQPKSTLWHTVTWKLKVNKWIFLCTPVPQEQFGSITSKQISANFLIDQLHKMRNWHWSNKTVSSCPEVGMLSTNLFFCLYLSNIAYQDIWLLTFSV